MIPKFDFKIPDSVENYTEPSKTYKMHVGKDYIKGYNDLIESVKQSVFKILNTERYSHYIYSKNYVAELENLIGQPIAYVCPEIERRIKEALVQDDRIVSVDSFSFDVKRKILCITFTVHCIFGDFEASKEVNI